VQARTRTTLWAETAPGAADYHPFEATNPITNPSLARTLTPTLIATLTPIPTLVLAQP